MLCYHHNWIWLRAYRLCASSGGAKVWFERVAQGLLATDAARFLHGFCNTAEMYSESEVPPCGNTVQSADLQLLGPARHSPSSAARVCVSSFPLLRCSASRRMVARCRLLALRGRWHKCELQTRFAHLRNAWYDYLTDHDGALEDYAPYVFLFVCCWGGASCAARSECIDSH